MVEPDKKPGVHPEDDQPDLDLDELAALSESEGGLGEPSPEDEDDELSEAYCVKCRTKVQMLNAEPVWTSKGTPGTRGTCPDCGTTVFRMGRTAAHDALVRPAAVRVESGTKIATSGRRRAQPATYINHTGADAVFAQKLATDLQNAGIHTWIDTAGTVVADVKWAGGVHPALRDSARMVVVLSAAAMADEAFNNAWKFFKAQKKIIVLVLVDVVEVPDPLRRSPRFAFSKENSKTYQKSFRQLVSALSE
jgi:hypothetical protein